MDLEYFTSAPYWNPRHDWIAIHIEGHLRSVGKWNWCTGTFWRCLPESDQQAESEALSFGDLGMDWEGIQTAVSESFPIGTNPGCSIIFPVDAITLPTDEYGDVPW